jgi:hypothetical protein
MRTNEKALLIFIGLYALGFAGLLAMMGATP